VTGRLIRMPLRPGVEPWVSKRQLAAHLGFTMRWVELRVAEGSRANGGAVGSASVSRRSSPG